MIKDLRVRPILNSRADWGIELELKTTDWHGASVPAGKSRGKHEAVQLSSDESVKLAAQLKSKLVHKKFNDQASFDKFLVSIAGKNKEKLGVDLVLASSIAFLRSQPKPVWKHLAELSKTSPAMPTPMLNILNGGLHAGNKLAVQEFMIVPIKGSFKDKLADAVQVYHTLGEIIKKKYRSTATAVGDEGGFAPPINSTQDALELIEQAMDEAGLAARTELALDFAASNFFSNNQYSIDGWKLSKEDYLDYVLGMIKDHSIMFVEDPLHEEDFDGFAELTKRCKAQIIGDDLLVTNPSRLDKAIKEKAGNTILIKPNQIGTVTETLQTIQLAKKAGWNYVVSHRSGETCDAFIADLAVGTAAPYIKTGAPCRGERTAKYNRLLKISEEL